MKRLLIVTAIVAFVAASLPACNMYQRESVMYVLTDPMEDQQAIAPAPEPATPWWQVWATMPPELAKTLGASPVGIVREAMKGLTNIVNGVVRIETGRARRAMTYSRTLVGARHELDLLGQFQAMGKEAMAVRGGEDAKLAEKPEVLAGGLRSLDPGDQQSVQPEPGPD